MRVAATFQDGNSRGWNIEASWMVDRTHLDRSTRNFPVPSIPVLEYAAVRTKTRALNTLFRHTIFAAWESPWSPDPSAKLEPEPLPLSPAQSSRKAHRPGLR